jgi:hypothetical protein
VNRDVLAAGEFESIVDQITERAIDPYTAAARILERATGRPGAIMKATLDHVGIAVGDLNETLFLTGGGWGLEGRAP